MKQLLVSCGLAALAIGSTSAHGEFATQSLTIDPLGLSQQSLTIDPLAFYGRSLTIDPLRLGAQSLTIDPLGNLQRSLTIDPLSLTIDPLSLTIDPLGMDEQSLTIDPLSLTIDPLHFLPQHLTIEALASVDGLSGNDAMLLGEADAFWGTFTPQSLTIDPLGVEEQSLTIDPLSLTIDPLSLTIDPLAAVNQLSLTIDPLALLDAQSLTIEALAAINPQSLTIDPLAALEELSLTIEALSTLSELSLTIDPLAALDIQSLTIEALAVLEEFSLTIDPLSLTIDALSFEEFSLTIEALAQLQEAHLTIEALSLTIDPLDMEALASQMSEADFERLSLTIDALGGLDQLSLTIDALAASAEALSTAVNAYGGMLASAEEAFGALVKAQTGKNFERGFLKGFKKKHGLSGNGFIDFVSMDEAERALLLIDFSDQLTTFLGIDHPDHWMGTVRWSPRVSEIAGYGEGVTVGVVDQAFRGRGALGSKPGRVFGKVNKGEGHGLAVSGVLAGALDGEGVMGVAPEADIVLANPFPRRGEADTERTASAIAAVGEAGASIINLSVGEVGFTFSSDWVEAFERPDVAAATENALFVMAAGNSGEVQTDNVDFGDLDTFNQIILVGALGLDGEIASFSNTAGDACFVSNGACTPMRERFLVAPGELVLVATDDGVGRASGTSFATPIVAGAAALLQSRWEWLQNSPETTADILFRTATDLGEEGVDDIYGQGLLNVEASQRPLDVNNLEFRTTDGAIAITNAGLTQDLLARVDGLDTITVFEDVGSTYRDFEIPVGVLRAASIDASVSIEQDVERYFGERLGVASGATQSVSGLSFAGVSGFTDAAALRSVGIGSERSAWDLRLEARQPSHGLALPAGALAFETHGTLTAKESGLTLRFGQGDGALAFSSGSAFGLTSDHDVLTGGVNPFLGLASGGGYFAADIPMGERFTVSGGFTFTDDADLVTNPFSGEITERIAGTDAYEASAATASVRYALNGATSVSLGVTALSETAGLFGGQSVGSLSFGETSESRSVTLGVNSALPRQVNLSFSATMGRTDGGRRTDGLLAIGDEGVVTSAFQAALSKQGILGDTDRMRLSFAQPLHVESGSISAQTLDVIDRQTGELGLVSDTLALNAGERRFVGELLYGTPVLQGRANLSMFGQVDTNPLLTPGETAATGGLRFEVSF